LCNLLLPIADTQMLNIDRRS